MGRYFSKLVSAIDTNMLSYYKFMAGCNGFKFADRDYYSYFASGKPVWGNAVLGLKRVDEEVVCELREKIGAGELPMVVSLGVENSGRHNSEAFTKGGFRLKDSLCGMVLMEGDLEYEARCPELTVKKCEGREDLEKWAEVVVTYLMRKPGAENIADYAKMAEAALAAKKDPAAYNAYVGYFGGKAVASSACFVDEGIGGIYAVAVAEGHRGRGFGYELTAACVRDGIENGVGSYILHASDQGRNLYKKLGFREANAIDRYIL